MKNITKKAFEFIAERNPLTDQLAQSEYVTLLVEFHRTHGDEAIQGLAGFYVYCIDNKDEEECNRAIRSTFAHDLAGASDKLMCPRSLDYAEIWTEELQKIEADAPMTVHVRN